jgi:hypothetical protein
MKGRDQHTVNELLYVLEHNDEFKQANCNIAIKTSEGRWWSIPCLDAFVTTKLRGIWFNDSEVEFEVDEYEGNKFGCVTVYETERSD